MSIMGLFSSPSPQSFKVLDKPLHCQMCDHDEFIRREALLNTFWATFFNMDWTNRSAMCFVCDRCGYVHWFVRK
jgi:hypothetical protein